jgi:hypothetical protein
MLIGLLDTLNGEQYELVLVLVPKLDPLLVGIGCLLVATVSRPSLHLFKCVLDSRKNPSVLFARHLLNPLNLVVVLDSLNLCSEVVHVAQDTSQVLVSPPVFD